MRDDELLMLKRFVLMQCSTLVPTDVTSLEVQLVLTTVLLILGILQPLTMD